MNFIRKYRTNLFIFFFLSFLIYFFILLKNEDFNLIEVIQDMKVTYLLWILLMVFAYLTIEALTLHLYTIHQVKGITFLESYKLNLATKFFNGITPLASGGQPFQIFYFHNRGIKTKDSTSIVLMNYNLYAFSYAIMGVFFLSFKYTYFNELLDGQGYLLLIGFILHLVVTFLIYGLALSKKIYHFIIDFLLPKLDRLFFLKRFKLIKHQERLKVYISDFNEAILDLNKRKRLWVYILSLNIVRIFILYSIPTVVFMALGVDVKEQIFNLIAAGYFIGLVISYVPLPGGSGGAEGIFYIIFMAMITSNQIVISGLILWRFLTFYLVIFMGLISLFRLKLKKDLYDVNYEENVL